MVSGGVYVLYEKRLRERLSEIASLVSQGRDLSQLKRKVLEEIVRRDSETWAARLRRVERHYEELEGALKEMGMPYLRFDAEAVEPLLVGSTGGLGYLLFEVGLAWDPVYDVPVIPGSAVKGVARSLVEETLKEEIAKEIFGDTGKEGHVGPLIFFDSYPVKATRGGLLEPDVINPHYNPLVSGLKSELDVRPVPVVHLSVRRGTVFRFLAALDKRFDDGRVGSVASNVLGGGAAGLMAYLLGGVMELGLGGRTLKGYGRFKLAGEVVYYDGHG